MDEAGGAVLFSRRLAVLSVAVALMSGCGSTTSHLLPPGSISGRIVESGYSPPPGGDVKRPVSGATVILTGDGKTKSIGTNASGEFLFPRLAPGRYQVKAVWGRFCTLATTVSVGAGESRPALGCGVSEPSGRQTSSKCPRHADPWTTRRATVQGITWTDTRRIHWPGWWG
jgi:hypothetical protein